MKLVKALRDHFADYSEADWAAVFFIGVMLIWCGFVAGAGIYTAVRVLHT